ncbi:MAG: hypothetical protein H6711_07875 [Myxococcales bacterium]|nr:hypothetical protein [Myxococcales bacterium]
MAHDPDHWLFRLDAAAWLRAAEAELTAGSEHLESRRSAVTHARRAAGMALNGVLVALVERGGDPDQATSRWGRSYVDHLRALAAALPPDVVAPLPRAAADEAAALLQIAPSGGGQALLQLGRGPHAAALEALGLARGLVERARVIVEADA